jgi:hypothetical protein
MKAPADLKKSHQVLWKASYDFWRNLGHSEAAAKQEADQKIVRVKKLAVTVRNEEFGH